MARHVGLSLPLFAAASTGGWGIGELPDIAPLAEWTARCGGDRLMLLPIGTMAEDQHSPYSASSAMGIDPIYLAIDAIVDFQQAGGLGCLSAEGADALAHARASNAVDYHLVRRAKREALDCAFTHFIHNEWEAHTSRAAALAAYIRREGWWLDDYALFQALSTVHRDVTWREWPDGLRDRDPVRLDATRRQYAREVLRHQYLQWLAEEQWQSARSAAEAAGVAIFGDVPFVVNLHSADVWTRADEFLLDVSVGVPPDAFSETGQDWGLPAYRWDLIAERDYPWIRLRARRMAALYSGFRLDHVIGFYRTYGRPSEGKPFFMPEDEDAQVRQGETLLRIFQDTGAMLIAEDLGTVPDFLRPSLRRLDVMGSKVLRWEREWNTPGQPFIDPATYEHDSCALTSTHDTETMPDWWENAAIDERAELLRLPLLAAKQVAAPEDPWTPALGDAMLELAWSAGSDELFVTIQDVFGWRDRVNVPATVGEHNWTWRLPWPVDRLLDVPDANARAEFCAALTRRHRRIRSL